MEFESKKMGVKGKSSMRGEEWRGDSPVGLLRFGAEFITAGQDTLKAYRKRNPPTPLEQHSGEVAPDAIYYNFYHGVELGLKSYLRHIDAVTLQNLRNRPYGHDLCCLLDESIRHGLRAKCPKLEDAHIEVIRCSNELYMPKEFEYIRIGLARYPSIDAVANAAKTLIAELKELPMQPAKQPIGRPDRRDCQAD